MWQMSILTTLEIYMVLFMMCKCKVISYTKGQPNPAFNRKEIAGIWRLSEKSPCFPSLETNNSTKRGTKTKIRPMMVFLRLQRFVRQKTKEQIV
mmetsp:Transcript_49707/g.50088  ORF Transcript_49707/g.50088 Transcript_49707/m.50088 type:complete len:94 (-) Transcript_49707:758-1039(-)